MKPPTPTSIGAGRQQDAASGATGDNYGPYGRAQRYNNPAGMGDQQSNNRRNDNYPNNMSASNYNSTNQYHQYGAGASKMDLVQDGSSLEQFSTTKAPYGNHFGNGSGHH